MHILKLLVLILPLLISHQVSAQPYKTLVARIKKHTPTNLYTITLNSHQHYVIDLTAPFSWYNCSPPHPLVVCHSPPCTEAHSYPSPHCPHRMTTTTSTTSDIPCSCMVTPVNPVTKSCAVSRMTYTDINLHWIFSRTRNDFNQIYISCAPDSLFRSLPKGAFGLASLSSSPLSFSSQFTQPNLEIAKKFGICLPSKPSTPGITFFGAGPYYILPPEDLILDAEGLLSYTPLIKVPESPGFFIGVDAVVVDGVSIPIPFSNTPTKISTIVPYTTLRSDVYKYLKRMFVNGTGTSGVPRVKRVKPFDLCWNVSALGSSELGFQVPHIVLEFGNGYQWPIFGSNSMKQIGQKACLAFVDGGKVNEGTAVVIGSFQMENNFFLFDLENSRLGFTNTLSFFRSTCGDFNYTATN